MNNRLYSCLGAIVAVVMSLAAAVPANAESISLKGNSAKHAVLNSLDRKKIYDTLTHYGVNKETVQLLISRYEQGYAWDSFTPGKLPKSTIKKETMSSVETIQTYEDGSIAVSSVPNFKSLTRASQTRSIEGCRYSKSGSTRYWKNCDGTVNLIVISMGFNFDYQNVNHKNPKITHYGSYHHHIIGGSISNFRFDRISSSQVRLSADLDVEFKGFPVGWTAWMQVNITGDNAWTSNN